jgi:hypothetical protein
MPFYIGNRKVKVVTGKKSQTINVYGDSDEEASYDPRLRIHNPTNFITQESLQLQNFPSVQAMITFLVEECGALNEGRRQIGVGGQPKGVRRIIPGNRQWARRVIPEVEKAINTLVDEFCRFPYLHRVEHSIHCELYRHLIQSKILNQFIGLGEIKTGTVHKEWPETRPRPEKGNRRGNFDIAIIAPPAANSPSVSFDDFLEGRIEPAVVIELGLDYGLAHLKDDAEKLKNSDVENGYLVHLARMKGGPQNEVDGYVQELVENEGNGGPRIAYVKVDAEKIRYRRLRDAGLSKKEVSVI